MHVHIMNQAMSQKFRSSVKCC